MYQEQVWYIYQTLDDDAMGATGGRDATLVFVPVHSTFSLGFSQDVNAMTPTTRGAPNPDGRGIREEILRAGLAIMRTDGIQALTQVQVARKASVRQSHVTYYFPKRHDLIAAVAGRFIDDISKGGAKATAHAPEGNLGTTLERVMSAIGDKGHMRMFIGLIVEADGDPDLRQLLVRLTRQMQELLATLIGGDNAQERAALVLASMWGIGLFDFVTRPRRRRTSLSADLTRIAGAAVPDFTSHTPARPRTSRSRRR